MVRKNPDFHFQLIMLLFVLAVFPLLLFGSQIRLSIMPFAHDNYPVWNQVALPSTSPTPWPTQTPLSYAQPKDQTNVDDLKTLIYVSPTATPVKTMEEILNAPNIFLGKAFSSLFSLVKQVFSVALSALGQFGH